VVSSAKLIRQVVQVSGGTFTIAAASYEDHTIDLTSYGFLTAPLAIPNSYGWLVTNAVNGISTTSLTGRLFNYTAASHSGSLKYILVEFM
jgi:hypothetical protein